VKTFVNQEIYGESINVDTINQLIYSLYTLLKKYSEKHYLGLFYGFHEITTLERLFYDGYDYLVNLTAQRDRLYLESKCVCTEELGMFVELVRKLVGECTALRIDLIEDTSGYDNWVLANPDKIAREVWEECLFKKCSPITFVLARDLSKAGQDCTIIYDLIRTIDDCILRYDLVKQDRDCALDYEVLMQTVKDCTITYEDFVLMHSCGLTSDVISKSVDCGTSVEINRKDKCIDLVYNLKKYQLSCYE
jgi:hypothetical protein